jgi:hypothetical protein
MHFLRFRSRLIAALAAAALLAAVVLPSVAAASESELTLFDSTGAAIAYIKVDDESTIYMWDGRPVAYLYDSGSSPDTPSIYDFDGNHLGWLNRGIVRDHNGYALGFLKGATSATTQFEPFKSFRQFKPFKGFREFAPSRPADIQQWSSTPLSVFLTKALSPA